MFPRRLRTEELYVAMNICQKALSYQELTAKHCLSAKIQGKKLHEEPEIVDCSSRPGGEAVLSEFCPAGGSQT